MLFTSVYILNRKPTDRYVPSSAMADTGFPKRGSEAHVNDRHFIISSVIFEVLKKKIVQK
jgi:hypothetical protein